MLNFHRTAGRTPNYLGRREQRRLLIWVLAIGIPVILIVQAIDFWRSADLPAAKRDDGAAIDPRLPERPSLALDAFTIEPEVDLDELPAEAGADATGDPHTRYFRGVIPAYLKSVRDDTPSRRSDQDASYNLLSVLKRNDLRDLKAASLGDVTYVQLYRQPETYRGRLVDLRGVVRRAHRIELPENHAGVTHYYQLWLFTPDSGEHPLVVYSLELPDRFPTGMKIHERVDLTGFFFKRVAYGAQGGGMTAPMLLTNSVQWNSVPPPTAEERQAVNEQWLTWLFSIAVAAVVVLAIVMWRVNSALRRPIIPRSELSPAEAEAIGREPTESVEEHLRNLSQQDS